MCLLGQCGITELGISGHDLVYCTRKTPSMKPNKHNDISIRSIKITHKKFFLELLRKTDLPDYATFTCLNKACQDFVFKLNEVIDLLCPSKKIRLKANSKPWIDSETISAIRRRDKRFKKCKKSGLETDKDHFQSAKMALQKAISKKKKYFFSRKIEKNANNSNELWKALKSLGMKSGKVNQSKIGLKNDGAIQYEPTKNTNVFNDFYYDLVGKLVRKLPVALNKFNSNSTKQYYMNIEKSCHNLELCIATL